MAKFTAGVIDTGGALTGKYLHKFSKKTWLNYLTLFRSLEEDESWKKPETKNLVHGLFKLRYVVSYRQIV